MSTKLKAAMTAGIMFFIISNPVIYKMVDDLLGDMLGRIANPPGGCPTTWGLILHSLVFATATYYGMGL